MEEFVQSGPTKKNKRLEQIFFCRQLEAYWMNCKFNAYGSSSLLVPTFHRKNLENIAKNASLQDFQYAEMGGRQTLKKIFLQKFPEMKIFKNVGIQLNINNIIITLGAIRAIKNAIQNICDQQGDQFILFQPYYPFHIPKKYAQGNINLRRVPYVFSQAQNQFKFDFEELEKNINPKTKVIVVCNPNNPTSRSHNRQQFTELGKILRRHPQITLIEDRAYFCYFSIKNQPAIFAEVNPDLFSRTVTIYSLGKLFDVTGLRCGIMIANKQIIHRIRSDIFCNAQIVATIEQIVCQMDLIDALEVDENGNNLYQRIRNNIEERALRVITQLKNRYDIDCTEYQGTYYIGMKIEKFRGKIQEQYYYKLNDKTKRTQELDLSFCRKLLLVTGVGLAPYSQIMGINKIDNIVRVSINRNDDELDLFLNSIKCMIN